MWVCHLFPALEMNSFLSWKHPVESVCMTSSNDALDHTMLYTHCKSQHFLGIGLLTSQSHGQLVFTNFKLVSFHLYVPLTVTSQLLWLLTHVEIRVDLVCSLSGTPQRTGGCQVHWTQQSEQNFHRESADRDWTLENPSSWEHCGAQGLSREFAFKVLSRNFSA